MDSWAGLSFTFFHKGDSKKDADIFTPENLRTMCKVQAAVTGYEEYKEVCLLNDARASTPSCNVTALGPGGTCPRSFCDPSGMDVLSHFYGKWHDFTCELLPASHVKRQAAFVTGAGAAAGVTSYFLEQKLTDLDVNKADADKHKTPALFSKNGTSAPQAAPVAFTRWTRSFVPLGAPLRGYKSRTDQPGVQTEEVLTHLAAIEQRLWDVFGRSWDQFPGSPYDEQRWEIDGVEVRFYGTRLRTVEILRYMNEDLVLVPVAILYMAIYAGLYTRSAFIAFAAVVCIFFTLPVGLVMHRYILQVTYFSTIHVIVLFIAVGIGIDDLFVFYDGWWDAIVHIPASASPDFRYLRMRMTFDRAASAIFTTSFTTCVCFILTGSSEVMPLASFGYYAACVVFLDYMFTNLVYPSVFSAYYEHFFSRRGCMPCGCCLFLPYVPEETNPDSKSRVVSDERYLGGGWDANYHHSGGDSKFFLGYYRVLSSCGCSMYHYEYHVPEAEREAA